MAALKKENNNVHSMIFASIKKRSAIGNSNRRLLDVASDLLNASGEKPSEIANGTFLCAQTIERVMDCGDGYRPQAETLERIFRYCNASVLFEEVAIKAAYKNKPKEEV